jgi:hypothetical protein
MTKQRQYFGGNSLKIIKSVSGWNLIFYFKTKVMMIFLLLKTAFSNKQIATF